MDILEEGGLVGRMAAGLAVAAAGQGSGCRSILEVAGWEDTTAATEVDRWRTAWVGQVSEQVGTAALAAAATTAGVALDSVLVLAKAAAQEARLSSLPSSWTWRTLKDL